MRAQSAISTCFWKTLMMFTPHPVYSTGPWNYIMIDPSSSAYYASAITPEPVSEDVHILSFFPNLVPYCHCHESLPANITGYHYKEPLEPMNDSCERLRPLLIKYLQQHRANTCILELLFYFSPIRKTYFTMPEYFFWQRRIVVIQDRVIWFHDGSSAITECPYSVNS